MRLKIECHSTKNIISSKNSSVHNWNLLQFQTMMLISYKKFNPKEMQIVQKIEKPVKTSE